MASNIDINGKKLLPIKDAISLVDYSRDYITRLARERKIVATQIGRKWYVDIESLKNYYESSQAEQEIKKRQLSDQRKKDLAIKDLKEEKRKQARKRLKRKTPALAVLSAIIALGFGMGVWLEPQAQVGFNDLSQLANVNIGTSESDEDVITVSKVRDLQDSSDKLVIPDFSSNFSHRKLSADEGLLLMPITSKDKVAIEEYFSDPVTVVTDEDGNSGVVRVDEGGNPIGEPIPFVNVPISSSSP